MNNLAAIMHKYNLKFYPTFSSIGGFVASIVIISIILISSCTKRECRGTIARPVLKLKLKKQYVTKAGNILFTKDTFLRITQIIGIGSIKDSGSVYKAIGPKDSLNILNLPLSPLSDTSSYYITWKDTNTKNPTKIKEYIKFKYEKRQVQTSELCGFQFYFNILSVDSLKRPLKTNGFQDIVITKSTVNLVNDTVHAYIYLNQKR